MSGCVGLFEIELLLFDCRVRSLVYSALAKYSYYFSIVLV